MTRSRYRFFETEYLYFLTNTIVGWLPVFDRQRCCFASCEGHKLRHKTDSD